MKPESVLLITFCLLSFQLNAQDSAISVALLHDSNVGFTPSSDSIVSANVISISFEKTLTKRLGPFSHLSLTGNLDVNEYNNYARDHINVGLQATYTRKLGLGFQTPRLTIGISGESKNYEINVDDIFVSSLTVGLSKPINQRIDLALNLRAERHRAKDDQITPERLQSQLSGNVFDRDFFSAELSSITYLDSNWSMPISISYVDGDLVSISKPNSSILARASAANNYSDIRPGAIAYRSDGHAYSVAIGLDRPLTEHSALSFLVTRQSGKAGNESKYSRHLLSLEYTFNW
jgi:hypothetical protein